jgi:hypothetical protein
LAALGATLDDVMGEPVEIWPENAVAVRVFMDMGTQWVRGGMAGAKTGLNYGVIETVMRLRKVPEAQYEAVWDQVRTMESAVLELQAETANG